MTTTPKPIADTSVRITVGRCGAGPWKRRGRAFVTIARNERIPTTYYRTDYGQAWETDAISAKRLDPDLADLAERGLKRFDRTKSTLATFGDPE